MNNNASVFHDEVAFKLYFQEKILVGFGETGETPDGLDFKFIFTDKSCGKLLRSWPVAATESDPEGGFAFSSG